MSEQQISICLSVLESPLTVHLDGEDALVAGCPHRRLDARLAQQQPARERVPRYQHYLEYLHIYTW